MHIDLNADLGESFGIFTLGDDDALLPVVTSANIAAGFHGGDPSVIRRTIRRAIVHGVAIGAHPSFPDLVGFGRREMRMADWEVEDAVLYQIASVAGVASAEGASLRHVKPHGALYNMAARDPHLAGAIVRAIAAFDRSLILFAPPASALIRAGEDAGLRVVREGFADRRYVATGHLASRQHSAAFVEDAADAARQAVALAVRGEVECLDGTIITLPVDTICIHGDLPGATSRAACVRAALEEAGVSLAAPRGA